VGPLPADAFLRGYFGQRFESFSLFPVIQNMPLSDEGNLWIQARNGDRKAFARLFDLHASALYRFASRLLGPGPDAEDVVQDVLLSMLQHDKFDPSRGSLRTYLFGAVRNQALKRQRVVLEELSPFVPSREATPDQEMARLQTSSALATAIKALPWSQREVLLLVHYEDLSLKEVAEVLELELAAVKSRLHRAREGLRIILQPLLVPKGDRR
jgi:RNA polymerase sigma-70 factor (ECF subfamily)